MTRRPGRPTTLAPRSYRPSRRTVLGLASAAALAVGVGGCSTDRRPTPLPTSGGTPVLTGDEVAPLLKGITQRDLGRLGTARLGEGLPPPTNRWFSGLVFGDAPQPVFPLPLSFGLTDAGFTAGLPTVTTTERTITGGHVAQLVVDLGASGARVDGYDTASVTVQHLDADGAPLGATLVAEGSPFVRFRALGERGLHVGGGFTPAGDGVWSAQLAGTRWGLVLLDGRLDGSTVRLADGGVAVWFPVPADGSLESLAPLARTEVTGTSLGWSLGADTVTTTVGYTGGERTAVAVLPHQRAGLVGDPADGLGSYPSLYGTMTLHATDALGWSVPRVRPVDRLDVASLRDNERAEVADRVRTDAAALPDFPADTYFGGKTLYRAAMLYRLATQLDVDDAAATVKERLVAALDTWTEPDGLTRRGERAFGYDPAARGVVGLTASFGSEEFNDHHFHYGYFLFAAGVLAADSPELVARWAPVLDLLAADIASNATGGVSTAGGAFPDLRVFDAYAGHSWASGTAPFADGNNQESSSEAVTAWTGLALWAAASGRTALAEQAEWLISAEAAGARAYWTDVDLAEPVYAGFRHQVLSLNWGGKRDYATWFSAEPAAILAIQLIPMSPVADYLAGDPARIDAAVQEASGGVFSQQFGDYLLMYSALAGGAQREAALAQARTLDPQWVDDGNSPAYLLAWLLTRPAG